MLTRPLRHSVSADVINGVGVLGDGELEARFEIVRTIGQGEFAKVKLAIDRQSGTRVAIKFVKLTDPSRTDSRSLARTKRIGREIDLLGKLKHPNIVRLEHVFRCGNALALVMEWASEGELFDFVQKRRRLREAETKVIMKQIIEAVEHMHSCGVVHRDLKLENVLLTEDQRVVVSDFGFATMWAEQQHLLNDDAPNSFPKVLTTSCGSPCYAAPELVMCRDGYHGMPVDVWSCGVILYAMLMGHLPFETEASKFYGRPDQSMMANVSELYNYIRDTNASFRLSRSIPISIEGEDLLRRMLQVDPSVPHHHSPDQDTSMVPRCHIINAIFLFRSGIAQSCPKAMFLSPKMNKYFWARPWHPSLPQSDFPPFQCPSEQVLEGDQTALASSIPLIFHFPISPERTSSPKHTLIFCTSLSCIVRVESA